MKPDKEKSRATSRGVRLARLSLREKEDLLDIRSLRTAFEEVYEREMKKVRAGKK